MGDSLVLPTFVLTLVYFMVFIIIIIRVLRIFRLTDDWRQTKYPRKKITAFHYNL